MGHAAAITFTAVVLLETAIVAWCALWPLRAELQDLAHAAGWLHLYSFALGNLDVLLLSVVKNGVLAVLVAATPAAKGRAFGAPKASNHGAVRIAIRALGIVHCMFLLIKAAGVAVTAPEQLWPPPPPPAPSPGVLASVGLVYMFTSIVASLVSSIICPPLACQMVRDREAQWAEDARDPLRAPLLGAAAAAGGSGAGVGSDAEGSAAGGTKKGMAADGTGGAEAEDASKSGKINSKTVWTLLHMSLPDMPIIVVAFAAGIIAALGSALVPHYTGLIIDYASIDPDRSRFKRTTLQLLAVAAMTGVFTGIRGGLFSISMTRLNVRLRKQLFHALLQMEVGFFDTTKTGEITSRLSADTTTVSDQVSLNLNVMLRSATQAAMVLFFMFSASWRLTVVTFILVPLVLLISKVYGKYYSRLSKKVQAELAAANGVAEEVLSTMTTVKAHAAQDGAYAMYGVKLDNYYGLQRTEAVLYACYATTNTFLPNTVTAAVLFYGGNLVLAGMMSPGALVSFMLYQQSLSSAFQQMGDVFSSLMAAVGAADKVIELMTRQPLVSAGGSEVLPELQGRVELSGIVFYYPARPHVRVLDGLSLVAHPGEVVALVGPSGGGKSSIVKMLERFYVPQGGCVLLDGHDIGSLEPKWLRRQVALVSQEPVLYARSIRRNICYGLEAEDGCSSPPTEEEVIEAAKQANAHDFISAFPDGYDTSCGEKGVALSGGQKQRIAIARALVRKPRVLLLDEATSALDADSEAVVQEALDRGMAGRTVLVIAHRLSTVQGADRIYVIGKGAVQEVGTHVDLLAAGGVYAQLVRRQLARPVSQANLSELRGSSVTSLASLDPTVGNGASPTALAAATAVSSSVPSPQPPTPGPAPQ